VAVVIIGVLFLASTGSGKKPANSHEERSYKDQGGPERELVAPKNVHISKKNLQKAVFEAQANRSPSAAGAERHLTKLHKRTKHASKQDMIDEHMQTVCHRITKAT
jgi:hypothetical protein